MVLINSYDRDLYTEISELNNNHLSDSQESINIIDLENKQYKSRYNYMIKFSPAEDEWIKTPIYENNPTKPATEKQAKDGKKGISNNLMVNNNTNKEKYGEKLGFLFNGI